MTSKLEKFYNNWKKNESRVHLIEPYGGEDRKYLEVPIFKYLTVSRQKYLKIPIDTLKLL